MSEYTRIAERARASSHLIELFDTSRSQWLWRCVKCKLEYASALHLESLTCIPNDPSIDYGAAPDLLALAERVVKTFGPNTVCFASLAEQAKAAIAKARGSVCTS